MPIHCPLQLAPITEADFERIDGAVMRCAYDSQNELGRLCDERVYENDIAARLRSLGFTNVHTQVPVAVSHDAFSKTYRLDLVVEQMVYELKTVLALVGEHDAQVIHYAVMLAIDRVKLLNLRTPKVQGLLRRSPLHRVDRRQFTLDANRWQAQSGECDEVLRRIQELLKDIGAFLEARLYEEALVHFFGGELRCTRRIEIRRGELELGTHRFCCHSEDMAFVVTAFHENSAAHEAQLRRLLRLTPLRGMQWFNLDHAHLQAMTLLKGKGMGARE